MQHYTLQTLHYLQRAVILDQPARAVERFLREHCPEPGPGTTAQTRTLRFSLVRPCYDPAFWERHTPRFDPLTGRRLEGDLHARAQRLSLANLAEQLDTIVRAGVGHLIVDAVRLAVAEAAVANPPHRIVNWSVQPDPKSLVLTVSLSAAPGAVPGDWSMELACARARDPVRQLRSLGVLSFDHPDNVAVLLARLRTQ